MTEWKLPLTCKETANKGEGVDSCLGVCIQHPLGLSFGIVPRKQVKEQTYQEGKAGSNLQVCQ